MVEFGALNNDGSATTLNLAKTVTAQSVVFYVSKVSATTVAVGLSELQLFMADASKFTSVVQPSPTPKPVTTTAAHTTTSRIIWYALLSIAPPESGGS